MKKVLFTILAGMMICGNAMDCAKAKVSMINTSSEIKANHQSYDSFNLEGQEALLSVDYQIMAKYNYIQSVAFYAKNCKSVNG